MVILLLLAILASALGVCVSLWLFPVITGGLTRFGSPLKIGTLRFGAESVRFSLRTPPGRRTASPAKGEKCVIPEDVSDRFALTGCALTPGPRVLVAIAGGFLGNCGRTTATVEPDVSMR